MPVSIICKKGWSLKFITEVCGKVLWTKPLYIIYQQKILFVFHEFLMSCAQPPPVLLISTSDQQKPKKKKGLHNRDNFKSNKLPHTLISNVQTLQQFIRGLASPASVISKLEKNRLLICRRHTPGGGMRPVLFVWTATRRQISRFSVCSFLLSVSSSGREKEREREREKKRERWGWKKWVLVDAAWRVVELRVLSHKAPQAFFKHSTCHLAFFTRR